MRSPATDGDAVLGPDISTHLSPIPERLVADDGCPLTERRHRRQSAGSPAECPGAVPCRPDCLPGSRRARRPVRRGSRCPAPTRPPAWLINSDGRTHATSRSVFAASLCWTGFLVCDGSPCRASSETSSVSGVVLVVRGSAASSSEPNRRRGRVGVVHAVSSLGVSCQSGALSASCLANQRPIADGATPNSRAMALFDQLAPAAAPRAPAGCPAPVLHHPSPG